MQTTLSTIFENKKFKVMMKQSIVDVVDLSHRYSVDWAIKNISFSVNSTGIVGLLGSNGAGKSTTMNIICGVLNQTHGDVFINGIDLRKNPVEAKKYIGFLPQKPPLHTDLTVDEYLVHCAELRRMDSKKVREAVELAKEKCSITHFSNRLIKNLSGGYQQRVGIAQSIVHNPKFVVLDEPTNGLDPNQILEIRGLIKTLAEEHAILVSTHILSEVQATCQEIKMIEKGNMVFSGTMEEFNNYVVPSSFTAKMHSAPALTILSQIENVVKVDEVYDGTYRLHFTGDDSITERFIAKAITEGWGLQEITLERSSLDTIFAQLSGKSIL